MKQGSLLRLHMNVNFVLLKVVLSVLNCIEACMKHICETFQHINIHQVHSLPVPVLMVVKSAFCHCQVCGVFSLIIVYVYFVTSKPLASVVLTSTSHSLLRRGQTRMGVDKKALILLVFST